MIPSYSIAYLSHDRDRGAHIYWHVWAAWLDGGPCDRRPAGKPWVSAAGCGRVRQSDFGRTYPRTEEAAEIEADSELRARGAARTRRIDASFARAAFRESIGHAPNWRALRPTKHKYATPRGFSRPPDMPAAQFFAEPVDAGAAHGRAVHGSDASRIHALREIGLPVTANAADVRRAARHWVSTSRAHPDQGGTEASFKAGMAKYEKALALVEGRA